MRTLLVLVLGLGLGASGACGSSTADHGAPTTPSSGTSTVSSAGSAGGCARACDRFFACAKPAQTRQACESSCARELADASVSAAYATCVEAIPCAELERSIDADFGPIGQCYEKAHRVP